MANHAAALDTSSSSSSSARVAVVASSTRTRATPEEVLPGEILVVPSLSSRSSSANYMPFRPYFSSGCWLLLSPLLPAL